MQTHDEHTPQQNFSSSLRASPLTPAQKYEAQKKLNNDKRQSPILKHVKEGKESLLKGLKLHKIPVSPTLHEEEEKE